MPSNGILVDTGPLVALLSARDQHHQACVTASKSLRGPFYTVWPVITEAAYLLRAQPSAVNALLDQIVAARLSICTLSAADVSSVSAILADYKDHAFDLADATLMHVAERENFDIVFTIDHRHFSLFRTKSGSSLRVVPGSV